MYLPAIDEIGNAPDGTVDAKDDIACGVSLFAPRKQRRQNRPRTPQAGPCSWWTMMQTSGTRSLRH